MREIKIKQATKEGSISIVEGGVADLSFPSSKTRRGRVQDNGTIAGALCTSNQLHQIKEIKDMGLAIRKLIPAECFILMGMTKEDYEKCKAVGVSDSQLYKISGNGLVTNCVQFIMEHLKKAYKPEYKTTDELMSEMYA